MSVPGFGSRRINTNIQTVDIAPTILDILGYPSDYAFSGLSLRRVIEGGDEPDRLLIAQRENEITLRYRNWKLFVHTGGDSVVPTHLYDTKRDPYEADSILLSNLTRAESFLEKYGKFPPEVRRVLKR
jgi:arylsulfatase A-like enzyme